MDESDVNILWPSKMTVISHMAFSNLSFWTNIFVFCPKFHWSCPIFWYCGCNQPYRMPYSFNVLTKWTNLIKIKLHNQAKCIGQVSWGKCTNHRKIKLSGHDDVINWKHFPRYWSFVRGIPSKASDAELWCFLWSVPEWTLEQTIARLVIWDAIYRAHYGVIVMENPEVSNILVRWNQPISYKTRWGSPNSIPVRLSFLVSYS